MYSQTVAFTGVFQPVAGVFCDGKLSTGVFASVVWCFLRRRPVLCATVTGYSVCCEEVVVVVVVVVVVFVAVVVVVVVVVIVVVV